MKFILNKKDYLEYRKGMNNTVEILDIAVYSERNKGTGTNLLKMLENEDLGHIYAFTRESNELAQGFYKKNGFRGTLLPNFYPDESAIVYIKS